MSSLYDLTAITAQIYLAISLVFQLTSTWMPLSGKTCSFGRIVGHKSVELHVVLVPLDGVEGLALHSEAALQLSIITNLAMGRNHYLGQLDCQSTWKKKKTQN